MPLTPVLARMVVTGMACKQSHFSSVTADMNARMLALAKAAYEAAGRNFLITSPQQLAEVSRAAPRTARQTHRRIPTPHILRRCCTTS